MYEDDMNNGLLARNGHRGRAVLKGSHQVDETGLVTQETPWNYLFIQKAVLACSILPNAFLCTKPKARETVPATAMYLSDTRRLFVDTEWREILAISCSVILLNHV